MEGDPRDAAAIHSQHGAPRMDPELVIEEAYRAHHIPEKSFLSVNPYAAEDRLH